MDAPDLPAAEHAAALAGLARLNRWSRAAATLWSAVAGLLAAERRPLTLLDVACGGGDLPVALALRARRAGLPLVVAGCDRSPTALACGRALAARHAVDVTWSVRDVVTQPLPGPADIVTCSLFLHHLSEADALALLAGMRAAAARALLLCDMRRTRAGLVLAGAATRLASRSPIVHADGPASGRAAFTPAELAEQASAAVLHGARVRSVFPHRMMFAWTRTGT
jgi:2-polyprenyl-3-methyl-5-hydroxy-6-metoxy-1,4-benzoquinol methylase